jgi:hypothetical protein
MLLYWQLRSFIALDAYAARLLFAGWCGKLNSA